MQKVVTNGLKIDLHIHSACSSLKDGVKVKGNTIANIPLLVQKLDEQQVNLCAITDCKFRPNGVTISLRAVYAFRFKRCGNFG